MTIFQCLNLDHLKLNTLTIKFLNEVDSYLLLDTISSDCFLGLKHT